MVLPNCNIYHYLFSNATALIVRKSENIHLPERWARIHENWEVAFPEIQPGTIALDRREKRSQELVSLALQWCCG